MSQDTIVTVVALALIGVCARFALSTAAGGKGEADAGQQAEAVPEPLAEPIAEPAEAGPAADAATGRTDRGAGKRERRAARRAVLEQRAATRRAERAAYAEKRALDRLQRARPLAALDPFAPGRDNAPIAPSTNGDVAPPTIETNDGLGPAIAYEVEPRSVRDRIGSLGPAIDANPKPAGASAPTKPGSTMSGAGTALGTATATKARPRIFTGEPVPLEPPEQPTKRALKLLAGMTALAAGGAIGVLALARAIAALFGR